MGRWWSPRSRAWSRRRLRSAQAPGWGSWPNRKSPIIEHRLQISFSFLVIIGDLEFVMCHLTILKGFRVFKLHLPVWGCRESLWARTPAWRGWDRSRAWRALPTLGGVENRHCHPQTFNLNVTVLLDYVDNGYCDKLFIATVLSQPYRSKRAILYRKIIGYYDIHLLWQFSLVCTNSVTITEKDCISTEVHIVMDCFKSYSAD